jgi:hypothetical protein
VRRSLTALLPSLVLAAAGCGTKVLELGGSDAGGAPFPDNFCVPYRDATGIPCMNCYDPWGRLMKTACATKVEPDGGAAALCAAKEDPAGNRCVYCGNETRACLKCEPLPSDQICRTCTWSDGAGPCKQCFDPNGTLIKDDCNVVRPDLPTPSL